MPYATIEFSTLRWPLKFEARLPPLPLFPLAVLPARVTLLSAVAPPSAFIPPPNAAAECPSPSASLFTIVVLMTLRGPSRCAMPPPSGSLAGPIRPWRFLHRRAGNRAPGHLVVGDQHPFHENRVRAAHVRVHAPARDGGDPPVRARSRITDVEFKMARTRSPVVVWWIVVAAAPAPRIVTSLLLTDTDELSEWTPGPRTISSDVGPASACSTAARKVQSPPLVAQSPSALVLSPPLESVFTVNVAPCAGAARTRSSSEVGRRALGGRCRLFLGRAVALFSRRRRQGSLVRLTGGREP